VVPQAYDQAFNGRLVEAAGVGCACRPGQAGADLEGLLSALDADGRRRSHAAALASTLRSSATASTTIAGRLLALTGSGPSPTRAEAMAVTAP
jgi:hypothetical protein